MDWAAVVGTFDGVHRGHRFLLDDLKARAKAAGLSTRVCTFSDHPLDTLRPDRSPLLLSTADEKRVLLRSCGIDRVDIDRFAPMASMTARQYIEHLASEGVKLLLIGHDNRFGSDGLTTLQQYADAASGTGVTILQAARLTDADGRPINSSRIRTFIENGDIAAANTLLGYEYNLTGTVVKGRQLGRTIGFPTANVAIESDSRKLLPPNGVYACRAVIDGKIIPAMVNIGHRPTVDHPDAPVSIEAHLITVAPRQLDLYGRQLTLRFVDRLRAEQRFPTLEALKEQLERDRVATLAATDGQSQII